MGARIDSMPIICKDKYHIKIMTGDIVFLQNGEYNIFNIMNMNIKKTTVEKQISNALKVLGSPFRIELLYTIGYGEVCVCHLEAILKKRQAFISQHLMLLRDAGYLKTRREGKFIYYRIADIDIFKLIEIAAVIQNIKIRDLPKLTEIGTQLDCACPNCEI